ncbi:MAG: AraC family transcriptional regulator [Vibrionaceae bacterium]|nr:AraC family transcriptional regulator [Vibrionaceae bacterium]
MHYAISHQLLRQDFLHSTPRRKLLKHTLLYVRDGLVLAKLSKQEYAVEAGHTFWLPFDTLCSITFFPNTTVQLVEVSCRVTSPLPKQGGYVALNELSQALINRLHDIDNDNEIRNDQLRVMRHELSTMQPKLKESQLTRNINQWHRDCRDSALSSEQQLVLKVREANKMMLSGKKRAQVIELLFNGDDSAFGQLEALLLGK